VAPRSVVVINSFCHVQGGASRVAIDEAVGLSSKGVQVVFLGAVGPVCGELSVAALKVICLNQSELADAPRNPAVALQCLWNVAAHRAMSRVLRELDPRDTVVHLHGFTQGLSSAPIRVALDNGFKVVCTLHDYFSVCPNGGFYDYAAQSLCHRRPLSLDCIRTNCDKRSYAHKLYRVLRAQTQRTLGGLPRGVLHYIALSSLSADLVRPYLPGGARIFSLDNPVEVARSAPVDAANNGTIVAIGRLDPEKGTNVLVRAAEIAGSRVLFVGDGSLRAVAESNPLCEVTGWLSREGVFAKLETARCLVFPSVCYETFGLSVAEAAARGVPAIVSSATGAAERVEHGRTGWLFRTGDIDDLASRLQYVRDDGAVSAAGRAAYDTFWSKPHTLEIHTEYLLGIYDDVLAA
jgi:glycosyltransferase involved in cell wall biosynthesis